MAGCGLMVQDVEQMTAVMAGSTNITMLRMANNPKLRDGGEAAVGRLLQHTPRIQVLDLGSCGIRIPELLHEADPALFTNLRVLDLHNNNHEELEVSDYLASMPRLQALALAQCSCHTLPPLLRLVANLPLTLTHLDVHRICPNKDVMQLTQQRERLARLHRLNIGGSNQDDERRSIREELQQLNPHIHVYYDDDERLWDMYRDTIQDT